MMHGTGSMMGLLTGSLVMEPFNPGFPEWFTFFNTCLIIVLLYVIKYRLSNRKDHQYIHMSEADDDDG